LIALAALTLLVAGSVSGYTPYFKEQFFRLYHQHYIQYPDDSVENIYWLEMAKKADFCNPLYALASVGDKRQWERYRYLLDMHLDLKLIEQHLYLGMKFDKRGAFFFNAPWKEQNLESLKTAESAYRTALSYWPEAKELARKAMGLPFVDLPGAEFWVDEAYRIVEGGLDYERIIGGELARLARVRADFEKMDSGAY
jgi:hypothetical protein